MIAEGVFNHLHAVRAQHIEKPDRIPDRGHGMHSRSGEFVNRPGQGSVESTDFGRHQFKLDRVLFDRRKVGDI